MVAEEQRPLGGIRDGRGLGEDVDDWEPVLHADRHEQPRYQRKVEVHVAFVALPEIGDSVFGPLIGL